jgi:hypothetical protein
VIAFGIFLVEMLDLYEWNCGKEQCKMQSCESKLERIGPAKVHHPNQNWDGYVLQKFIAISKKGRTAKGIFERKAPFCSSNE